MIDQKMIPPEAEEAVARRLFESNTCFLRNQEEIPDWDAAPETLKKVFRDEARAAIAAALAAWPGAWDWPDPADGRAIVLPLSQEARDE